MPRQPGRRKLREARSCRCSASGWPGPGRWPGLMAVGNGGGCRRFPRHSARRGLAGLGGLGMPGRTVLAPCSAGPGGAQLGWWESGPATNRQRNRLG